MKAQIRLSRISLTAALALAPAVTTLGAVAADAQAAPTGTVTIVKDAQPNGPRNFTFTTDMRHANEEGLDNFTLDDDPASSRPNTEVFEGVEPGTYFVTEQATDGWDLSDINCTGADTSTIVATRRVGITVAAGDSITCTFVNIKAAAGDPTPLPSPSPSPTRTESAPIQDGTTSQPVVSAQTQQAPIQPAELPARLPRTGTGTGAMAAIGAAMVAFGTAILTRSRLRTAKNKIRS